ncbi:hypothetical protein GALMADRAFT_139119 [Galerina marginata CBS 339.88]|uniref:Uncharacterized protein n=1 Tax=Galerina marginata (strain CBS 339.88) TaxID=685588 RepID=A0A067TDN7_GALM3|nr:hypothetical protein GALMADRAFT_139119 [Galerina marginata CBS 339.88]
MKNNLFRIFHSISASATHPISSAEQHVHQQLHPTTSQPSSPADLPQSSMSNFPAELLLEIFDHVCEQPRISEALQVDVDGYSGPLLLGRVCKQWRDIAWLAPTLWTFIYFVPSSDKYAVQSKLLDAYLRRSKDLPLTIVFRMKEFSKPYDYEDNRLLPLYKLIAQECHRWEVIDIFIPYFCVSYLNTTCHKFPLLRTASVEAARTGALPSFVRNAIHMRDLGLTVFPMPKLETPHLHLTHFRATRLASDQVLDAFALTPNLRSCIVEDMTRISPGAVASPHIHLKKLETFTFSTRNASGVESHLFQNISTPILREFRCRARLGNDLPLYLIKTLLDRSSCQLEGFELKTSGLDSLDINARLDPLLRRLTTVSRLVLDFEECTWDQTWPTTIAKFLDPLWPPAPPHWPSLGVVVDFDNDCPVLLPNLRHLDLRVRVMTQWGFILPVLNMVKHRWMFANAATSDFTATMPQSPDGGKQFAKIVSVRLPDWCYSEAMREFRDEIQEGLTVDFFESSPLHGSEFLNDPQNH